MSTPHGQYNPNRAVLMRNDGQTRLALVVETKVAIGGAPYARKKEVKVKCEEKHFTWTSFWGQATRAFGFSAVAHGVVLD